MCTVLRTALHTWNGTVRRQAPAALHLSTPHQHTALAPRSATACVLPLITTLHAIEAKWMKERAPQKVKQHGNVSMVVAGLHGGSLTPRSLPRCPRNQAAPDGSRVISCSCIHKRSNLTHLQSWLREDGACFWRAICRNRPIKQADRPRHLIGAFSSPSGVGPRTLRPRGAGAPWLPRPWTLTAFLTSRQHPKRTEGVVTSSLG